MVNTAWDLLDSEFMLVAATVRDLFPSSIKFSISIASATASTRQPST